MPWNTLAAFSATPTAAQINTYLQNLEWLRSPPKDSFEYTGGTDYTTTTATWADISADFSHTFTTSGGYVLVLFSAAIKRLEIDIRVDGTRMGAAPTTTGTGLARVDTDFVTQCTLPILLTSLSAGSHTISAQWKYTGAGTGTIAAANAPRFYCREL
jgi:hypothetical protein